MSHQLKCIVVGAGYLRFIHSINKHNKPPRKILLPETHARHIRNYKRPIPSTQLQVIRTPQRQSTKIMEREFRTRAQHGWNGEFTTPEFEFGGVGLAGG